MSICKYCKHVNEDGTMFCQVCGKSLDVFPGQSASAPDATGSAPDVPQSAPAPGQEGMGIPVSQKSGPAPKQTTPSNTFPMNDKDRQAYAEHLANPGKSDHDGLCIIALMFGMISFLINPLFITSLVAIILGIIGHALGGPKSSIAKLGWILGLISLIIYLVIAVAFALLAYSLIGWIIHLFI